MEVWRQGAFIFFSYSIECCCLFCQIQNTFSQIIWCWTIASEWKIIHKAYHLISLVATSSCMLLITTNRYATSGVNNKVCLIFFYVTFFKSKYLTLNLWSMKLLLTSLNLKIWCFSNINQIRHWHKVIGFMFLVHWRVIFFFVYYNTHGSNFLLCGKEIPLHLFTPFLIGKTSGFVVKFRTAV